LSSDKTIHKIKQSTANVAVSAFQAGLVLVIVALASVMTGFTFIPVPSHRGCLIVEVWRMVQWLAQG
jgi:hypothetical protein